MADSSWRHGIFTVLFAVVGCFCASAGWAAYTMKVAITAPKGSSGDKPAAKYPTATRTLPCDGPGFDAITMTATYDASNAAKQVDRDVYLMLFNPEAIGAPRFMVLKKQNIGSPLVVHWRNDFSEINPREDVYLPRGENLSTTGAVTEVLVSSVVSAQGATSGIWQLIGIVADSSSATLNFDDPATWDAWDVATVVLRKPWRGQIATICQ